MPKVHFKCSEAGNVFHVGRLATANNLSPGLINDTVTLLYKRKLINSSPLRTPQVRVIWSNHSGVLLKGMTHSWKPLSSQVRVHHILEDNGKSMADVVLSVVLDDLVT